MGVDLGLALLERDGPDEGEDFDLSSSWMRL
jgi:hypothetical protein